ncbi:MAG: hypothetical protein U9R79_14190 [Armatimonadota bacterium]|nr:hypothetical protein [Armatimonadota bacterium]
MRGLCLVAVMAMAVSMAGAQLDVDALAEAYRAFDMERNEGMGHSDKPDSGSLGWGEGGIIESYARMWEVTGDTYWLEKTRDHFRRIMGNASDPDGDGYLSWQTTTYSTAIAWAERLHNVSDAQIQPPHQKQMSGKEAAKATGHTYLIEFPESPQALRIVDWTTREVVAEDVPYEDGAAITLIEPFSVTISGATHQGDRFMVRTQQAQPLEFTVHQGMFIYPVALFIEAVKTTPELQEEFGEDAETFLQFINTHLFEKNERDWLDMGELGGGYRFEPKITDRYPNRIMPHNQYGALARAWLVLAEVEGAHPLMAQRAEQMCQYFRSYLELDEDHDAWRWHYWDWTEYGEPDHSGWEDTSHGHIDVSLAVEAARRGVVFTDADMRRFVNTWLEVMWNGDEETPRMAHRVAEDENFRHSALLRSWTELAQWDRRVYELALTEFQNKDAEGQAAWAPAMLLCASRAGALQ